MRFKSTNKAWNEQKFNMTFVSSWSFICHSYAPPSKHFAFVFNLLSSWWNSCQLINISHCSTTALQLCIPYCILRNRLINQKRCYVFQTIQKWLVICYPFTIRTMKKIGHGNRSHRFHLKKKLPVTAHNSSSIVQGFKGYITVKK